MSDSPTQLPRPDQDALDHSARMCSLIQGEILRNDGALPFDRYMELALYAPGLGYYTAGARKFGEAGDFITAPEVSSVFSRCMARQCLQVMEMLGSGDLMEFGAGSGVMAADILAELERLDSLPERYLIVDLSPDLKQRQREMLTQRVPHLMDRVSWLEEMPEDGFCGVILANELLDAMPVSRFRLEQEQLLEQFVILQEGELSLSWQSPVTAGLVEKVAVLGEQYDFPRDDYESELNLRAISWLQMLGAGFSQGAVLLIDYGYGGQEYYHPQRNRGTLLCHYRHRAHDHPLWLPGLQDITAQVDFTAAAVAARQAGFDLAGYTTQACFLMANGLDQQVAASDPDDVQAHMALVQGVKQLTLPGEMGERFKVLGLTRGIAEPLSGFSMRDYLDRL